LDFGFWILNFVPQVVIGMSFELKIHAIEAGKMKEFMLYILIFRFFNDF